MGIFPAVGKLGHKNNRLSFSNLYGVLLLLPQRGNEGIENTISNVGVFHITGPIDNGIL